MELIQDIAYLDQWFHENEVCFIIPYIEKNFYESSFSHQYWFMKKHLFFAKKIIEDDAMSNQEKHYRFIKALTYNDGGGGKIVLIDGAKGGGKTGFGCWVLDQYYKNHPNKKYFFVTKAEFKPKLPSWIIVVDKIEDVKNDSVVLIDEGAIQLSSRRSLTKENKDASDRLIVLRHKNISMIILVQNIKMVDVNVRRLADIRVLKFGIPFGGEDERASDDVEEIRKRLRPRNNTEAYMEISSRAVFLKFTHDLPEWFDEDLTSKSFRNTIFKTHTEDKKKKGDDKDWILNRI